MTVLRINLRSKLLGMQTNVTVCLPGPHHDDDGSFYRPGMKFQTLYLLHGGAGDDADYLHWTGVARYADEARIAVVMPADYNAFYTDHPEGPRYFRYVVEELPRICQSLFPLSPKREDNFVAGLSMGGHGAMKVGVMKPEAYAAVLCMSGAAIGPKQIKAFAARFRQRRINEERPRISLETIFGGLDDFEGGPNDVWHYAKLNVEQGKMLPSFHFAVGDQDFAREGVEEAYAFLKLLGYDTDLDLVPGYGHEWDFWDLTLKQALRDWFPIRRNVIYPDQA